MSTKGKQRLSSVNVGTMNPLNEEDESTLANTADEATNETEVDHSADVTCHPAAEAFDKRQEQTKIRDNIDSIFKSLPPCDEVMNLDKDNKRLEALEQLLIDRIIYETQQPKTPRVLETPRVLRPSSAAYSSSVTKDHLSREKIHSSDEKPVEVPFDPCLLTLNNLQLSNECIKNFSKERLIEQINSSIPVGGLDDDSLASSYRSDISSQLFSLPSQQVSNPIAEFVKNAKKVTDLDLKQNRFDTLPVKLFEIFRNTEKINLSENNFEFINLFDLIRQKTLKELNLSSNLITSFDKPDMTEEEEEIKSNIIQSGDPLMKSLERLDLSNNRLNGLACMIVNQMKGLKYLNLSNNEFQLNPLCNDFYQMPWQSNKSLLSDLLELDLSKNNKNPHVGENAELDATQASNSSQRTPSISVMSNYSSIYSETARKKSNSRLIRSTYYFSRLTNLRVLNISECNLHNMPNDIKELRHLQELYLDNNFLEFLPNELTALRTLRILSASNNKISELIKSFCEGAKFKSNLTRLNLSKNQLKNSTFTYKFGIFSALTDLDLSHNLFELVPNPLPKSIVELNLSNNKIKSLMIIPMSSQERTDQEILGALGLRDRKFGKHAASSFEDSAMKKAFLLDESIYDEPDIDKKDELQMPHVFFLRQLKRIHLMDNLIGEVPADFGVLNSKLEYIDLSRNLLTKIDLSLCRGLVGLKHLNLQANQIASLPDKIRELSDLEYLNLSYNSITSLNYELCNSLKNLKELHLNHNSLETLVIAPIKKRSLGRTLFGNSTLEVESAPATASSAAPSPPTSPGKFSFNLPTLKRLNLSSNKFADSFSIYRAFGLLPKLSELDLSSNRIRFVDSETVQEDSVVSSMSFGSLNDDLGEKKKLLSQPKYLMYELRTINLSHNQIEFNQGGFIRMLCDISRLAPNLDGFIFDQKFGRKLKMPENDVDEAFYFEFENPMRSLEDNLIKKLKRINLSNNGLTRIPGFMFKLENLKEIYFNGNCLKKIPNEMFQEPKVVREDSHFFELKMKQEIEEEEKRLAEDDDSDEEEMALKKKRFKKKKKKVAEMIEAAKLASKEVEPTPRTSLLCDRLEVLQLSENRIEHIPDNLFSSFKSLVELKLEYNPLKDPPGHAVSISGKLSRASLSQIKTKAKEKKLRAIEEQTITLAAPAVPNANTKSYKKVPGGSSTSEFQKAPTSTLFSMPNFTFSLDTKEAQKSETSELNLPNLFFENPNLKPLQSFMVHHKRREDILLCNMFLVIKDCIDSKETLLKIMRRLKMPMDKVEYVCKEIQNNVAKNWSKIAEQEYPPVPGKLSLTRRELAKRMHQYILKLQAWNLMNAWRNTFGPDAPSDELIRILKLMNSNEREDRLYHKVFKLKCTANMFKV